MMPTTPLRPCITDQAMSFLIEMPKSTIPLCTTSSSPLYRTTKTCREDTGGTGRSTPLLTALPLPTEGPTPGSSNNEFCVYGQRFVFILFFFYFVCGLKIPRMFCTSGCLPILHHHSGSHTPLSVEAYCVFSCFYNPPSSDTDHRIFSPLALLLRVHTEGG